MCVPWELNPRHFALLTQCSTSEPQEHTCVYNICKSPICLMYVYRNIFNIHIRNKHTATHSYIQYIHTHTHTYIQKLFCFYYNLEWQCFLPLWLLVCTQFPHRLQQINFLSLTDAIYCSTSILHHPLPNNHSFWWHFVSKQASMMRIMGFCPCVFLPWISPNCMWKFCPFLFENAELLDSKVIE